MRTVIGGNGTDTTSAALALMDDNSELILMHLFLIGLPEHPQAIYATDFEAPLVWRPRGTFLPAVITRSTVTSQIGLQVDTMDVAYAPANKSFTDSVVDTSPLQLAQIGFYDNWPIRVWRVIMPKFGDADSIGAYVLFGGRVAQTVVDEQKIVFTINSFLDVVNQQIPANVIESTNVLASFAGAHPPTGFATVPQFTVFADGTQTVIDGDCTNFAGHIFSDHVFQNGWLVFNSPTSGLRSIFATIADNTSFTDGGGHVHNRFTIFGELPWTPVGSDTFFVSAPFPVDQADESGVGYFGFPYVPDPEGGV